MKEEMTDKNDLLIVITDQMNKYGGNIHQFALPFLVYC